MPIPAAIIEYVPAPTPIREAVTKFGGQPVWLEAPQWPISRALGIPMQFICQIKLDDVPGLHAELKGTERMAYVFMTDGTEYDDDPRWDWRTYDSEGGENAVILQPNGESPLVKTKPDATGPTLTGAETEHLPIELAVRLAPQEEREVRDPQGHLGVGAFDTRQCSPKFSEEELKRLWAVKLGGLPAMNWEITYPPGGPWLPFLQLRDTWKPFFLNLGTDGFGHAFISLDGHRGRFLSHR